MTRAVSLIVVVADRSPRWLYDIHNPFVHLLIFSARKRLVAPIPWGGEEEAQEEASCSESQLLLYGREVSRYSFSTCGLSSSFHLTTTVRQFVLIHLSLWGNVLIFSFFFFLFRMLQDHDSVQPRSDSCAVCWLFNSPVSAHWRQSTSHRGSVWTYSIHLNNLTAGSTARVSYLNPEFSYCRVC